MSYVVTATVTNDCGTDTKTQNVSVLCQAPPCVSIDLNAPTIACVGSTIQLCGTVTNCSNTTENIEVHYQQQSQLVSSVPPGQSRSFCFEVRMPECTQGDVREWTVTAVATNDCGRAEKTAVDETKCKLPEIKVKKAAESVVNDGEIIHYTIIVENPGEAPLQNVTITDPLCPYTVYNDHANPQPTSEPAVGANGTVTWVIPTLAKGESMALTFEAKASLSTGGASCPGDVLCRNKVTASGTCSGTTDTTPVTSTDETGDDDPLRRAELPADGRLLDAAVRPEGQRQHEVHGAAARRHRGEDRRRVDVLQLELRLDAVELLRRHQPAEADGPAQAGRAPVRRVAGELLDRPAEHHARARAASCCSTRTRRSAAPGSTRRRSAR